MKLRIWQKILALMLIPLSFEIAATAVLMNVLNSTENSAARFYNSRKILSEYHTMQNHLNEAGIDIATMGVYREDGSPPNFEEDRKRVEQAKEGVLKAADVHPNVREALNLAPALFDHALELIEKAKKNYNDPTIPFRKKGSLLKNDVFNLLMDSDPLVRRIVDVETTIDSLEASELEKSRWLLIGSAVGAFLLSLLITLLAALTFYRSFGKRLQLIEGNAEKVALHQELPAALSGGDEIDELDRTLHSAAQFVQSIHQKEFAVLNKSVDVLCSIDARFKIISIGESVEKSWFYRVDDVLGRSIFTLLPEPDAVRIRKILSESTEAAVEHDFESEFKCGDGETREFAWKVRWNPAESSYFCVLRDISERKKIERAKQRLLAIASHDLRTPLMSVSANLSSLAAGRFGELDGNLQRALTESEQNLDKLMDLIQSLLDLERMESTGANLEMGCVSALDTALQAISSIEPEARTANINILPPTRDEAIMADERRLTQILTNLLRNGLNRSKANQTVTVTVASNGPLVRIYVIDEGAAISADEHDLIFEKYFQSHNDDQRRDRRASLNLALAKVLTEAQNGVIGVTSESGRGNQFYVQFSKFELPSNEDKA
jgi:PAS domain S-box-containing protein